LSSSIQRRIAVLEARHQPVPSYVVWVSAEEHVDPAAVEAAIAEHQSRTGWTGPVITVPPEATLEEWVAAQRPSL
jgi:hypothetical protein